MKSIGDLLLEVSIFTQNHGCAPTMEDINDQIQSRHQGWGDPQLLTPDFVQEYVEAGFVVMDAEGRIYQIDAMYHHVAYEKRLAQSKSMSYEQHTKGMFAKGYRYTPEGLRKED